MNHDQAYQNIGWYHLRVGQSVSRTDDERHCGRIEAIHNSIAVKVRWENGWISDESAHQLQKVMT